MMALKVKKAARALRGVGAQEEGRVEFPLPLRISGGFRGSADGMWSP
jgi:hypothetical protein